MIWSRPSEGPRRSSDYPVSGAGRPTIISLQETTEAIAGKRYALLKQLPARFLYDVDEPTLLTAGRFKARHRLSLADALIAAFAVREEAILVHKDPEFESLSKQVKQEAHAYK